MFIACVETATWYDAISKSTVEEKSCKEVQCVHSFTKDSTCASVGKEIWKQSNLGIRRQKLTNQTLTEDYLNCVIGVREAMFTSHRLLVWDSFKCHVSKDTKDYLKMLKVEQAVIPGGCTGFIQAPDVCWNKPLQTNYTKSNNDWFEAGKHKFQQQTILNLQLWRQLLTGLSKHGTAFLVILL